MTGSSTSVLLYMARQTLLCLYCVMLAVPTQGQEVRSAATTDSVSVVVDQTLAEVLDAYRQAGIPLVYSTNLVRPEQTVKHRPQANQPIAIIKEVLKPHGLTLKKDHNVYLVIRDPTARPVDNTPATETRNRQPVFDNNTLEQITVTASLYRLGRNDEHSSHSVDGQALDSLPAIGNDPLRALQRLPGAATQGISSKLRFRGGHGDETGILINGQKIRQPFHVRDFQSLFSAVDTRIADQIEVYSGGFPAQYGNQLSGLVLIDSLSPEKNSITELGLSVFNTSVFSGGTFKQDESGKWLFSARRGNLDLILDKRFGQPSYYDLFGEFHYPLSASTSVTFNALHASDRVVLTTETDPVEDEKSVSKIENTNFWVQLDQHWSRHLRSTTSLAHSNLDLNRTGINNQEEKLFGEVLDERVVGLFGLRQDWVLALNSLHTLRWGAEFQRLSARYNYAASAEYFDFYSSFQNIDGNLTRSFSRKISGEAWSAYVTDRWQVNDRLAFNYGTRWDRQTYTDQSADRNLFSPRISAVMHWGLNTDITASWGRYFQSQDINNLQVEDGEQAFNPAQRAEQAIVGVRHSLSKDLAIRLEFYRNSLTRVMPRYENILDPIALIPELEPDRLRIAPDRGRSLGVELSLTKDSDQPLNWWLSYVWSRAEDRIDGLWQPRSWDQPHALQAGIIYDDDRWQVSAALNVHSGWPASNLLVDENAPEDEAFLRLGPRNAEQLNTFASLDVRVARTFAVRRGSLNAFLEISNVTNRANECCTDFTLDETVNGLILDGEREHGLPLLPAIGVLWKF